MSTFIHTADTHLGYRQYHRPEREQDYLDAFEQVISAAIEKDAEAVIHAGDFFHDSRPTTETIRSALEQLKRLDKHGIEFLGVVGNHEETQADQWLDILSELSLATHLTSDPHIVGDTAFYGIDHVPESRRTQLSYEFTDHDTEYAFLVLHGLVAPLAPLGTWELDEILGRSNLTFDGVLLGDDHTPRIERRDNTVVTYPGSTERTATDQTQERVYNLITTDNDEPAVWIDQIPLDTRPHVFLEIELEDGEGQERIFRTLDDESIDDSVVAIVVTGDGEPITPAAIEEYGKQQGAFVVRVSDRRQLDTEDLDIDVTFADPDDAVQERIRQMGLSLPAYDIERKVRNLDGIKKSNLAEAIETEFDERIDDYRDEFEEDAEIEPPDPTSERLDEFTESGAVESDTSTAESVADSEGESTPNAEAVIEGEDEAGTAAESESEPDEEDRSRTSQQLSLDDLGS